MSLIEELKSADDRAFDTWFERWFEKSNFPEAFKKAAQQGYSGFTIELERHTPQSDKEAYLNRRLRDPRTVIKLKERLPDIDVELTRKQKTSLFGLSYTVEELKFKW